MALFLEPTLGFQDHMALRLLITKLHRELVLIILLVEKWETPLLACSRDRAVSKQSFPQEALFRSSNSDRASYRDCPFEQEVKARAFAWVVPCRVTVTLRTADFARPTIRTRLTPPRELMAQARMPSSSVKPCKCKEGCDQAARQNS